MTEDQIHIALAEHLRLRARPGVLWWHTPNGGKRNVIEATKLKRMGTLAGVADFLFLYKGTFFSLEIKTEKGRLSAVQEQWSDDVEMSGGESAWAAGLDNALAIINMWGLFE